MKYASRTLLYGSLTTWVMSWIALPVVLLAVLFYHPNANAKTAADKSTAYVDNIETRNALTEALSDPNATVTNENGNETITFTNSRTKQPGTIVINSTSRTVVVNGNTYNVESLNTSMEVILSQVQELASWFIATVPNPDRYADQIVPVLRVFEGYANGQLGLNDNMSRAQAASVVARTFNLLPTGNQKTMTFSDVTLKNTHAVSIEALYDHQITGGCASNPLRYCPEQTITRRQFAILFGKALRLQGYNEGSLISDTVPLDFNDVPVGSAGYGEIKILNNLGLVKGCGGGNFCPDQPLSRGQASLILANYYRNNLD